MYLLGMKLDLCITEHKDIQYSSVHARAVYSSSKQT